MKFVDEFRDAAPIRQTLHEIAQLADPAHPCRIMEVCGGHTHAIFRFGLHELLPAGIELIHGPGCPVCVLPPARIDLGLRLAQEAGGIFTAFGDVLRVPGRLYSPLEAKARGLDVRMVYSPLDALALAQRMPERNVLYFAIGFETTAPATAVTLQLARQRGVHNFRVISNHILIPPALRVLLNRTDLRVDAFIGPGHVSTVIGCRPYEFVAREFGRPVVIAGFEPLDLLQAILLILRQRRAGVARVENHYRRAVSDDGNLAARRAMNEVFEERDRFEWRGLGTLPDSGLALRPAFAAWDAERPTRASDLTSEFAAARREDAAEPALPCGDVLAGVMKPRRCPHFGTRCTPERPLGALMVSAEGACAAEHRFSLHSLAAD